MRNFWLYVIIGLLLVIIFQNGCSNNKTSGTKDTTLLNSESRFDSTIHHFHTINNLVPADSIFVPVPIALDSAAIAAILKSYFASYDYKQDFRDSNIVATMFARVNRNKLDSIHFSYKNLRPTIINNYSVAEKKNKVFAGGFIGLNRSGLTCFGPELLLLTKKDHSYRIGVDLLNKGVVAGTHFKINLKKQ